jgi:succinyl-diaminopimelate desuccinylase
MVEEPSAETSGAQAAAGLVGAEAAEAAASEVDPNQVVTMARALVAAPSENPGGDERAAAAVVRALLDDIGVASSVIEGREGRPNVVATIGEGRPKLAWNGHLDVVPAGDSASWMHPPWAAVVEDGVLWGRGSADMKGPIASALAAVAAIRRAGVTTAGALELHLVADEEHRGIHGTRVLFEAGRLDADACIVGEPSRMELGLAARGGAFFNAIARGKAAHGSTPHLGVNAIEAMSRFVLALPEALPDLHHPLLGGPTVNPAMIRGGRAPNVVPDECVLTIDRRTLPGETLEDVRAPFERLLDRLRREFTGFDLRLELSDLTQAAEIPADAPIATVVRAAAREERGQDPPDIGFTGITDARFYVNGADTPAVVFGPGDLRVAHTSNEHVRVDDLVAAARVYTRSFVGFLGTAPAAGPPPAER